MTKIFCDSCSNEITDKNKNIKLLKYESFEVIACIGKPKPKVYYRNSEEDDNSVIPSSELHICLHCIVDVYKKADNRPQAVQAKPPVSKLSEGNQF